MRQAARGRSRWTLTLLADTMGQAHRSRQPVGRDHDAPPAAENDLKPWRRDMWCIPHVDGEYVARMEDVLDLYAETPDRLAAGLLRRGHNPANRRGAPAGPGATETARALRFTSIAAAAPSVTCSTFDPHRGQQRNVKVTDRRAAVDYAQCMRELVDVHYPDAAASVSCRTICRSINLGRCMRPSRPPRLDASCAASIPLHSETRQLAQHGRVRDQRAAAPVSRPPHLATIPKGSKRNRSMATAAK